MTPAWLVVWLLGHSHQLVRSQGVVPQRGEVFLDDDVDVQVDGLVEICQLVWDEQAGVGVQGDVDEELFVLVVHLELGQFGGEINGIVVYTGKPRHTLQPLQVGHHPLFNGVRVHDVESHGGAGVVQD